MHKGVSGKILEITNVSLPFGVHDFAQVNLSNHLPDRGREFIVKNDEEEN